MNLLSFVCGTTALAVMTTSIAAQDCPNSGQSTGIRPDVSLGAVADKDIVATAVEAGSFNTLVAAVKAAGLVETLKGKGTFTVFAPTDDAFAKLPPQTIEHLLKPENKDQLTAILTYHVVPGRVMAKDVVNLSFAATVNGQRVDIETNNDGVVIDGAKVVTTDISCSNGVIHIIDSVMMPSTDDIVDTAASAGSFGTLLAAAKAAGLVDALRGDGPLTVFAPTDDAFAMLPAGTVESLLKPENKDQLVSILTYHVVAGRIYSDQALEAGSATTLQGGDVRIGITDGTPMINDASLIATDIDASNGVIHVIDSVLIPSGQHPSMASNRHDTVTVMDPGREIQRWNVVVDGVMGGRSTGNVSRTDRGALQFSGDLSLANNGGFSQIRRRVDGEVLTGSHGIELTVRGDGREYNFDIRTTDAPVQAGSYQQGFSTVDGEWVTHRLPFTEFNLFSYGRAIPGAPAISPSKIESIGFTLSDKKEGDFRLQVASIRAYTDGEIDSQSGRGVSDSMSRADAVELIELAISRGVPLFNDGQVAACAAIYEVTIEGLILVGADKLGEATIDRLKIGRADAIGHQSASDLAWAFRRTLDEAYAQLSPREQ